MLLSRRNAMIGAALTVTLQGLPVFAQSKNNSQELINKFTGGVKPVEGKVKLDVPEIAENGNTVPITFMVDSPMTAASHVQEVLVVVDGNPNGGVGLFKFSPEISVPEGNTRIRLAETQNIMAVAKMSDGTFQIASKNIKVTIGGCGG